MTDGKSTKEAVSLKIYESAEDYLEKILMLTERNGEVLWTNDCSRRKADGCGGMCQRKFSGLCVYVH